VNAPITLTDFAILAGVANPFCVVFDTAVNLSGMAGGFEDRFEVAVGRFVAAQLGVALLFGLTAAARLRHAKVWAGPAAKKAVPPAAAAPRTGPKPTGWVRPPRRPPIGEWPVYWWARYSEVKQVPALQFLSPTPKNFFRAWLVLVGLFAFSYLLDYAWPWGLNRITSITEGLTLFALWGGTLMTMLPALFRSAAAVARERSTDTLDSLRLTALDSREILFQKWLGCAAAELPVFKVLLVVASAGLVTGYVHPLSLIGLALVVPIYVGAAAAIGLYFSVRAATPGRAVRNMVLIGGAVLYLLGAILSSREFGRHEEARVAVVIPPMVTGMALAAGPALREERQHNPWRSGFVSKDFLRGALACLIGPTLWGVTGWLAWRAAVRRFDAERHN
jgi:hypothetical protein